MKGFQVTRLVLCLTLFTGCATSPQDNRNDVSSDAALEAYTRLGLQYLQARDTANARASVQRALEINNDYAPAYNALGLIFQFEDETQLAEQYYKDAIRLDRDSAMFHNNYGAFLYAQKRYREACNELEKATSDPFYTGRGRAFENLGRCYNQIGENVKALDAFERSLKTGGRRPYSLVELAQLYLSVNDLAKAEGYYKEFERLVDDKRIDHSAKSLWVGIQLSRANSDTSKSVTYALLLKNLYPDSQEYQLYKESTR